MSLSRALAVRIQRPYGRGCRSTAVSCTRPKNDISRRCGAPEGTGVPGTITQPGRQRRAAADLSRRQPRSRCSRYVSRPERTFLLRLSGPRPTALSPWGATDVLLKLRAPCGHVASKRGRMLCPSWASLLCAHHLLCAACGCEPPPALRQWAATPVARDFRCP